MADYSKIKHLKDLNNSMFNERMNRAYDYGYEDGLARGTECGYKRGYENGQKSKQTDKERLSRMTRKEASKIIKDGLEDMSLDFADEEQYEALIMAISALSQEPSGDLISRQAVLDSLHNKFADGFDSDRWWNSMSVLYAINKAPSVKQERTGHWIDCSNGWMCSECHKDNTYDTDFCPNCGCDMVEQKSEE